MPQKADWFDDIMFYEKEFNGIMPLEILIDTKRKKGVTKLSTIKKMSQIEDVILEIPELSKPISMVSLVTILNKLITMGIQNIIKSQLLKKTLLFYYAKNSTSDSDVDLIKNYVDSTGQYTRITTFMKDMEIDRIEEDLKAKALKIFPQDRYTVSFTGKALLFQKGTKYLVKNLIISLSLAILLIALFMAWMFRSFRMILVSLIPNLLPLIITAGLMGFLGVPIKPSTILVFSIAFGISVDDTIHFLAKYRQELQTTGKLKNLFITLFGKLELVCFILQ